MSSVIKRIACPVCVAEGLDTKGDNLARFDNGAYACFREGHTKLVAKYQPELASRAIGIKWEPLPKPVPPKSAKQINLLARIKADYPATVADLWESSPIRCDENLNDTKAFLRLFPTDAILWVSANIRDSGRPEHTLCFQRRDEWEQEKLTVPGTRIAPGWFRHGTISRSPKNVLEHLFTVIESDDLEKYPTKDHFCSLIEWFRKSCGWKLAAVVDSGNKSLHTWFHYPGDADMAQLAEHVAELGIDTNYSNAAHPWRLPGVKRERSDQHQRLVYLGAIL